jgi:hypothetical protein
LSFTKGKRIESTGVAPLRREVSNPRVRWNPNKASEYVQVIENDPNNTLNEINNILNDINHTMATRRYFDFELAYFS